MRKVVLLPSLLGLGLALACAQGLQQPAAPEADEPHPALSPEDVVSIQLRALKHNDRPSKDHGIRIAFRFASPANRASTGPIERFIRMVKNPLYRPMLNYKSEFREPLETIGDIARQKVTLVSEEGKTASYLFVLSKQTEEPYQDCWMTDSVMRVEPEGDQVAEAGARMAGGVGRGG